MSLQPEELVEKIRAYDPQVDADGILKAYRFADEAHGPQLRASGEPYITHPLAVADILTVLKLDDASIKTALLHDTVEDTSVTLADIEREFGKEVARLVDGVTKLGKLEFQSEQERQAENFRKLLLAMSEDIRVLLVKLGDRVHNMRTLHFIAKPEKRQRIAKETLDIYATLAERMGVRTIKEELQDLAFRELYPEARDSITKRLSFLRKQGQDMVEMVITDIRKHLNEHGIKAEITGREKKPYSIWKKMSEKNITLEQLSDIIAFRIIVKDIADCYGVLGTIHSAYHTVPGRFKDYISTPKANGYRSLHTSVMGPGQQRIEIQIRTDEMHQIAEYGVAAHWAYKHGQDSAGHIEGRQFRWIRELLEILEKAEGAEEFLENTRLQMYHDQVFCFTPRGDIIALPRGATPVDFAYAVHSGVGSACVGAKVNGRIVPLKHQLRNGDQVEIITSKAQTPSPSWEKFVVTGKARSEIRRFIRTQQRQEYVNLGKAMLDKTFRQEGFEFTEKLVEPVVKQFNKKHIDDLFAEVGEGLIPRRKVLEAVFPHKQPSALKRTFSLSKLKKKPVKSGDHALPIRGLIAGMAVHFAKCCHPLPGDRIVGIVTTGKGITIHTIDCETLENYSDTPERWIDVAWDTEQTEQDIYVGRLRILVSHEPGSLAALANIIAKDMGNISNLKILSRSTDFFELILDVEVKDARHLNSIIADLRSRNMVHSVERHYL